MHQFAKDSLSKEQSVISSRFTNNRLYRPYNKINLPTYSGGDPRGWILKAEKYFRYYQIPKVLFLGHIVSFEGVQIDQEKVATIQSWPVPNNVREVHGFLVECDASSEGVEAILTQNKHPIAYFSKGFSPSNRLKSAYDRELLALVLAVQKWNDYLMVVPRTRAQMLYPGGLKCWQFHCLDISDLQAAMSQDPYNVRIMDGLAHDPSLFPGYTLKGHMLYCKGRTVVPKVADLRDKLIQEAHDTPDAGHGGFLKTFKRLTIQFYWPNMSSDVRVFIQQCATCQRNKYYTLFPARLLQPLPIPQQVGVDRRGLLLWRGKEESFFDQCLLWRGDRDQIEIEIGYDKQRNKYTNGGEERRWQRLLVGYGFCYYRLFVMKDDGIS
ncbi:hypothetical protein E3N88_30365 [Mikania micrantha]|uniref:Integrase zinc-binding domain-containing protein n=1 Tax=Mikania micrantha TaxID=192012 RepID=A0A5N6MLE0_9ASTR|nr:hypothetical protein E3N88_30365 [Mikania micrantha]